MSDPARIEAKHSSPEDQVEYLMKLQEAHYAKYQRDVLNLTRELDRARSWADLLYKRTQTPIRTAVRYWFLQKLVRLGLFRDLDNETRNQISDQ